MENLYDFVFWYNAFNKVWYAIPTKEYNDFFSGKVDKDDYLSSSQIETLIEYISKEKHKK